MISLLAVMAAGNGVDTSAARLEAIGLARDLMRLDHDGRDWSDWLVRVTDDRNRVVLDLPFSGALGP